ncbi:MAG: S-layer homology domain-containing protein [Oscillospiraceae bacterium]|jgi:hypothetical protein|nr:S-layer homology domain-containing protein [Oscillospiraceae bacterium]
MAKTFFCKFLAFALVAALSVPVFAHEGEEHAAGAEQGMGMEHHDEPAAEDATASRDYAGHWAEATIKDWASGGALKWYHGGDFNPDVPITRAEFVSAVNVVFGYSGGAAGAFPDIAAHDWFSEDVAAGAAAGYIAGYPDGAFKPNAQVTREQAAKIISISLKLDAAAHADTPFTDAEHFAEWSRGYIAAATGAGCFLGYGDGSFRPTGSVTRAEALTLLARVALSPGAAPPGVQVLLITYNDLWNSDTINVAPGEKVRWYVYAAPGSLPASGMACGKTIKIPGLGWGTDTHNQDEGHLTLTAGYNFVYEFTPEETGDILYTCWMGSECHSNYIHVVAAEGEN